MFTEYNNFTGHSKKHILDKVGFFQPKSTDIFSYFSMKTYVVVLIRSALSEALLMSTHNIYFFVEKLEKYYMDTPSYLEL